MNKRNILSLFLVGSLLGGLSVTFTGCIDNDEPEGIKTLREAKAGLLNAKTVLAAADAAVQQANAQLVLAQAEVEKARAEQIRLQAEADAAKTQAETDSIKAEIEKIKAQAEEALNNAEAARVVVEKQSALAQIAIKEALLNFETGAKQAYLTFYYNNYQTALNEYNTAYESFITTKRNYLNALADNKLERYDTEYNLTQQAVSAANALAENQATIEALQAALEEAANLQPSELQVKKDSLEAIIANIDQKKNEIELARAEAENENHELIEKKDQLWAAYNATIDGTLKAYIPEFTYYFPQLDVVHGFNGKFTPEYNEGWRSFYVFDIYADVTEDYWNAINTLYNEQAKVQRALLDENDLAWAAAKATELTNDLKSLQTQFEKDSTAWAEAVAVYNNGAPDIKKFTKYSTVTKALAAYNETVTAWNAGKDSLDAANKELAAAQTAYNKVVDPENGTLIEQAAQTRDQAKAAADEDYNKALAKYTESQTAIVEELQAKVVDAQNHVTTLTQKKVAAEAAEAANKTTETTAAVTAAENELKQAKTDLATAKQNLEDAQDAKSVEKLLNQKELELKATKEQAYYEADKAYEETIKAYGEVMVVDEAAKAAAQKVVEAAKAKVAAAKAVLNDDYTDKDGKAVKSLTTQRNEAYAAFSKSITDLSDLLSVPAQKIADTKTGKYATLAESDITITAEQARNNVIAKSDVVYGYGWGSDTNSDSDYSLPVEQLLPLTQDKIDATLALDYIPSYLASAFYDNFGSYGQLLAAKANIEKYTILVNNPTIIEEVDKQFTDAIAALQALRDDLAAQVVEAYNAALAQQALVDELEADFDAQKFEVEVQEKGLQKIVDALYAVIGADEPSALQSVAAITGYITKLNEELANAQAQTSTLEHNAERAQKALEGWQNGDANQTDAAEALMELAESKLANLQDQVDAAKAALDAAIAYLETLE
jgi:hypothetical protein